MEEEYDKSGSAWTQYDVRLLLHFMVGALVNDYHSFHLACNVKAAGKFDDVVFRYRRNEGEPEKLRLIQAKNTETTAITADDLVSKTNGDFDLMKYLDSYNEIRNSDKFREMEVQDAVLFTTRKIDKNLPPIQFSDITLTLDDSKDEDDILSFHGTTSRRLKFSSSEAENKFQIENNLHDFFKHFTLALIQPNEEQLATFTKQRFHALVPFYNGSFSDFYLELESQVTAWYKEKNGIWLAKDQAMKWVSKAAGQDFPVDYEKRYIPRTSLWPKLRLKSDGGDQTVTVCDNRQQFDESAGDAILVNEETGLLLQFKGSLDAINEIVERDTLLRSRPTQYGKRPESKADEDKYGPKWFSEEAKEEESINSPMSTELQDSPMTFGGGEGGFTWMSGCTRPAWNS